MKTEIHNKDIPLHELESLARCLLPDMLAYFESEDGQREFEAWKQQRKKAEQGNNE